MVMRLPGKSQGWLAMVVTSRLHAETIAAICQGRASLRPLLITGEAPTAGTITQTDIRDPLLRFAAICVSWFATISAICLSWFATISTQAARPREAG